MKIRSVQQKKQNEEKQIKSQKNTTNIQESSSKSHNGLRNSRELIAIGMKNLSSFKHGKQTNERVGPADESPTVTRCGRRPLTAGTTDGDTSGFRKWLAVRDHASMRPSSCMHRFDALNVSRLSLFFCCYQ